jgi:hypothetical protein
MSNLERLHKKLNTRSKPMSVASSCSRRRRENAAIRFVERAAEESLAFDNPYGQHKRYKVRIAPSEFVSDPNQSLVSNLATNSLAT